MTEHKYLMDYIKDKSVFKAVMFARQMIRKGERAAVAMIVAARYYDVDRSVVAGYVSQVGHRVRAARKMRKASRRGRGGAQ